MNRKGEPTRAELTVLRDSGRVARFKDATQQVLKKLEAETRVPEAVVDEFIEKRLPALLARLSSSR